jgi:hypothetical protein
MTRIVELLVGAAALTTIATFIIGRAAWKGALKKFGRPAEDRKTDIPFERSDVERREGP